MNDAVHADPLIDTQNVNDHPDPEESAEPGIAALPATEAEDLYLESLRWLADATLIAQTIEEARVVPIAPTSDDMWELGKLCSEHMGLSQKVNRAARAAGISFAGRERDDSRRFLLADKKVTDWYEALVVEAVVGPFFRLFYESFLRGSEPRFTALVKTLWAESQPFIRFGQARIARVIESGGSIEKFQAAVDKWLPVAVALADEVPDELGERWLAAGYWEKPYSALFADYTEEMATYINATDLEIPESCVDAIPVAEVRWVGEDIAPRTSTGRPLAPATFAFSKRSTGRDTASAPTQPEATG